MRVYGVAMDPRTMKAYSEAGIDLLERFANDAEVRRLVRLRKVRLATKKAVEAEMTAMLARLERRLLYGRDSE